MSDQPAEEIPQGWSVVSASELDAIAMEIQPLGLGLDALASFFPGAWQVRMMEERRAAEAWRRKNTAEIGRRLAKDLAGLKK